MDWKAITAATINGVTNKLKRVKPPRIQAKDGGSSSNSAKGVRVGLKTTEAPKIALKPVTIILIRKILLGSILFYRLTVEISGPEPASG